MTTEFATLSSLKNHEWTIPTSSKPISGSGRVEQLFSTVGDGSGTTEMANTNATATYKIAPPQDTMYSIRRINVYIEDNGKFRGEYYGATSAVSGGIVLRHNATAGIQKIISPQAITKLGHWGLLSGVDMIITDFTTGNDIALVRFTLSNGSAPLLLDGNKGDALELVVTGILGTGGCGLVSHIVQAQGSLYSV